MILKPLLTNLLGHLRYTVHIRTHIIAGADPGVFDEGDDTNWTSNYTLIYFKLSYFFLKHGDLGRTKAV